MKDSTVLWIVWFICGLVGVLLICILIHVGVFVEPPSDCNTPELGNIYTDTPSPNDAIVLEDEDGGTITFSLPDPNDTAVFASPDAIAFCTIDGSLLFTPAWNSDTEQPGYQISRQAIQILAESGRICDVLGHNWRDGRPGEGEGDPLGVWLDDTLNTVHADYHPNTWYRTCRICGKCEERSLGDWK